MGGSNFDLIAREILKQKQLMEQMLDENRELRQQLSDLRAGRGIFVAIEGKHFALTMPSVSLPPSFSSSLSIAQENTSSTHAPSDRSTATTTASSPNLAAEEQPTSILEEVVETTEMAEAVHRGERGETVEAVEVTVGSETEVTKALPMSGPKKPHITTKLSPEEVAPHFLEEALIDEFTNAATSPLAVWSGPPAPYPTKQQTEVNEEEKAALRRQLIGSFLLE